MHATLRSAGHDVSDLTVYAKELEKEVARLKARVSTDLCWFQRCVHLSVKLQTGMGRR